MRETFHGAPEMSPFEKTYAGGSTLLAGSWRYIEVGVDSKMDMAQLVGRIKMPIMKTSRYDWPITFPSITKEN